MSRWFAVTLVRRGIYRTLPAEPDRTTLDRAVEIVKSVPGAIVSHETAAELHGMPHLNSRRARRDEQAITITTPQAMHELGLGYRTVAAPVPGEQVTLIDGLPVTNVWRTAVDVARMSDLATGLAIIDALARRSISETLGSTENLRYEVADPFRADVVRRNLYAVTDGMRKWFGVARARRAIQLLDPGSESILESISRAGMIEFGLPSPRCGVPIRVGRSVKWLDFYWEEFRVAGEADGAVKYESNERMVLFDEKRREDQLRAMGVYVVRWTWADAHPRPYEMARLISQAFDRAGRRYGS